MEKKMYEGMEMEVVRFDAEDVVTASRQVSADCGNERPNAISADGIAGYAFQACCYTYLTLHDTLTGTRQTALRCLPFF